MTDKDSLVLIMRKITKTGLVIFLLCLLLLSCALRSRMLVDTTFFPRFTLLSVILLIVWISGVHRMIYLHHPIFITAFILFLAWTLLSAFWSVEPAEALLQSLMVFLSLTLYLVISALAERFCEFEDLFIRVFIFLLLLYFTLAFLKMSTLQFYDPYRIISISANNNLYSGFLLISLTLVFSGYHRLNGAWKILSAATGILVFFFIIIIQTRAAYLGTLTALLIVFLFLKIGYPEVFSKLNMLRGMLCLGILCIGIFIFTLSLDHTRRQYFLQKIMVWEYFRSYEDLQARNIRKLQQPESEDHSKLDAFDYSERYYSNANLRMIFWEKSLGLIASRPLTGVGAGSWKLAIPSIKQPPNPEHTIGNFTYSEPHNEWIKIITELGIIGFILALFVFFLPPVSVLYRISFKFQKPPMETLFYAAFIIGFYVFAAFDFPLRRIEHNIVLWSVFAMMLNKVSLPAMKRDHTMVSDWRFSLIFIGLLIFSSLFAVFRMRGEYYTMEVYRNESKNDLQVVASCHKAENIFYHITPNTLPVSWFEGVACFRLGDYQSAGKCFERAIKITPYEVRVLNDYGANLFQQGKTREAIEILKEALSIDPFFDDARFNLGAIYFLTGQTGKAWQEIMHCRESQKKRDFLNEISQDSETLIRN